MRITLKGPGDIRALRDAFNHPVDMRPIVVELPGGLLTDGYDISLGLDLAGANTPDITVLGRGSVLRTGMLQIEGGNITVTDIVFDGRQDERVLSLHATESLTLDHVAIVDLMEPDRGRGSLTLRGAGLYASTPTATLTIRDSLFLDNKHGLDVRGFNSGEGFATVRFERTRFAGNVAPAFYFGRVDRLEFVDSVRLGGTGDLVKVSPRTVVVSEPTEKPEDAATLAAWRAELASWGAAPGSGPQR